MKVVMMAPFGLYPKGTARVRALPMAQALVERGHQVTLLIPPWDQPSDAGTSFQSSGVQVINLSLPRRLPLAFHGVLTARLARQALALRPDVVHCFKPKGYAGLGHWLLWWLRRLRLARPGPRLVVDEDDWERAWNAVLPYSALQKRLFAWQERWGLRHADAVTAASRELLKLIPGEGVAASRIFYVPNGVWPSAGPRSSMRAQTVRMLWELDDAPVILLYSRFLEFRLERIVSIMRQVVAGEPRARLLVVGEGWYGEHTDLDDLLTAAGLADYVRFTGWLPAEQLPDHFAAADVAMFPYDDTLINRTKCSVKLTELLAAGLPVVADAVGQNSEYIVDGVTGRLVEAENDGAFAEALLQLLADPPQRARLGAAAARDIQERFAWPRLIGEVERAYQAGANLA